MSDHWLQIVRFWSFQDRSVQTAVAAVLLLAISCGSLGCFIVLRRMSLLGDSLGHAVLPGVCCGFMVTWTKDIRWIFAGAVVAALLASWLIGIIERYTRLKSDVALGLVLSGFFGLGLVLLKRIEKTAGGSQAGLNQFLFGQAAAINERDLWLIGGISLVVVIGVVASFKELAVTSFDAGFAAAIGIPVRFIHYLLMSLTALAIVISLQAVGVVLLSALLITPAATALLLTDRLKAMVLLSILFAAAGGVIGLNLSTLKKDLPTGPMIVLVLTMIFLSAYFFSPRYGIVARAWRRRRRARRTQRENLLKNVYLAMSSAEGERTSADDIAAGTGQITLAELGRLRSATPAALRSELRPLVRHRWIEITGDHVRLTEPGASRARELDRNYRLWEMFLTHEVRLPADHTDRDAEDIEHLLTPELVRELEDKYEPRQTSRGQ
jgi:manganese/zinc/iron transport system permease protein